MPKAIDITGKKFGRLLVVGRAPRPEGGRNAMWHCKCDCGAMTIAAAANIGKSTLSCGCLAKETAADLLRGNTYQRTHHMSQSLEYKTWAVMKQRCHNPKNHKYPAYGGRGIRVCDRWFNSFEAFYEDMGKKPSKGHTIDRINNDGHYEPGNCRWATSRQQSLNTRTVQNITIDGVTLCVKDWCKVLGVERSAPYELTRKRRAKDPTPFAPDIETAVKMLHAKHKR